MPYDCSIVDLGDRHDDVLHGNTRLALRDLPCPASSYDADARGAAPV